MRRMGSRIVAAVVSLTLVTGLVPTAAFASADDPVVLGDPAEIEEIVAGENQDEPSSEEVTSEESPAGSLWEGDVPNEDVDDLLDEEPAEEEPAEEEPAEEEPTGEEPLADNDGDDDSLDVDDEADSEELLVEEAIEATEATEEPAEPDVEQVEAANDTSVVAAVEEVEDSSELGLSAQADQQQSLADATIARIASQAYTGKKVKPAPKVNLGSKTLKLNTDYTVAYANNTEVGKATVTVTGKGAYTGSKKATFKIVAPTVTYAAHIQSVGDQARKKNGAVAGSIGKGRRLEAVWLQLGSNFPVTGGITYRSRVQGTGWESAWSKDGAVSGTKGSSKRLEAIQIKLTGKMAKKYDVYYRVHAQSVGWMAWAKNGAVAGTVGMGLRLEGIQVVLLPKGAAAPGEVRNISSAVSFARLSNPGITYQTHVQTYGWLKWTKNGAKSGTTGESKRLEALKVKLASTKISGGVRYRTHVQTYGWQGWKKNGRLSGTEGESKRLEAIRIELTGEVAKYFDVYYRTHVQTYGWLGWAKNGEKSGTAKLSRRMESLQVKLVPKGAAAPGSTDRTFIDNDPTLSGDAELDAMIGEFVKRTGTGYEGLRNAYNIISGYPYTAGNHWPGPDWKTWSIPYAKEMYLNGTGNCYRYASLMCWTARRLGYDAKVVPGWNHGVNVLRIDHGWVEVFLDGQVYLIDAELNSANAYPEYDWFMIKYSEARVSYYDLNDNRLL